MSRTGDDIVVPFQVEPLDIRGRAVQLGPMLDAILKRHDYPTPVCGMLGEMIALAVLLGTSLKFPNPVGRAGLSGGCRFFNTKCCSCICPFR